MVKKNVKNPKGADGHPHGNPSVGRTGRTHKIGGEATALKVGVERSRISDIPGGSLMSEE